MKKVIFCIAMLLISSIAMGQTHPTKVGEKKSNTKVERVDNRTFKSASSTKKSGGDYKPTGYYYEVRGEKREIYLHTISRGENKGKVACYIQNPKSGWRKLDNIKPEDLK